jgi:hypothetical protein
VSTHRITDAVRELIAQRPLLWASRLATLGLGSHAEISVAESIHLGAWAWLLPVAIDTYAVSCFAARRASLALAVLALTYGGGIGWLCWSETQISGNVQLGSAIVGAVIGLILVIVLWHGESVVEDGKDERRNTADQVGRLGAALADAQGQIKDLKAAKQALSRELEALRLAGADVSAAVDRASGEAYDKGLKDGERRAIEAAKLPHIGAGAPADLTEADMPFLATARKVAADPDVTGREAFKAAMREHGQPIGNDRYSRLIKALAS